MQVEVTGLVLATSVVRDYDCRMVILTKERGKIVAFASGVRKGKSSLSAACQPFTYGEFSLFEGKDSYRLIQADIKEYNEALKADLFGIAYGTYICEVADCLTRENMDTREMLKLVYVTLRVIAKEQVPRELIRRIFEIRALALEGEEMQVFHCCKCGGEGTGYLFKANLGGIVCTDRCAFDYSLAEVLHPSTVYTLQYILSSELSKVYSFRVSLEVQGELDGICNDFMDLYVDRPFKSAHFIDSLS